MKADVLAEIGLSKNEAKVYLALLELGSATGGQVAEKANVHRTNAYDALGRLKEKGMVSSIVKDKTRHYEAADPQNLMNFLKDKERKLADVMPELLLSKKMAKPESEASVFEGVSPFMDMLYHFLEYKEPILVYGIPKLAPDMLKTKIPHFHKVRIPKKIPMKHIYNYAAKERMKVLNTMPLTEARYLPEEFDSQVSTMICGDEVVLALWVKPPLIIRIKNAKIADAYKKYFNLLWKSAKKP